MCAEAATVVREAAFHEVRDSQAAFRALLDVLSRPGELRQLPDCGYRAVPPGLCSPALTILKTLCDHRVSFSVGSQGRETELVRYLEVNLAAPFKPVPEADYVVFDGKSFDEDFHRMNVGSAEFPENAATAVVCVSGLAGGDVAAPGQPSCTLVLAGPGIADRSVLTVVGLDPRYGEARRAGHARYPLGTDLFFVDPAGRVAGLPRSCRVEVI